MSKSEKILKLLSSLVENGILSSQDVKSEILNSLKFKKDEIISCIKIFCSFVVYNCNF